MRQEEVLRGLREIGPCTARELAMHIHGDSYDRNARDMAHARLRTLHRQGFVRKVGERKTGPGKPSPVWDVVE